MIRRGENHPQYKHGRETLESKAARKTAITQLHHLCDLGNQIGLFEKDTKLRGRRPKNKN
jgi:hypothetical protein